MSCICGERGTDGGGEGGVTGGGGGGGVTGVENYNHVVCACVCYPHYQPLTGVCSIRRVHCISLV